MGHLAFAAAIEALVSNALSRRYINDLSDNPEVKSEDTQPVRIWSHWLAVAQSLRRPSFLRPCNGKG